MVPSPYSRHVDADHLLFVAEHEFGDGLRQLGLADAGRPEEKQHAVGLVMILLERAFVQAQPFGDGLDRFLLADDALCRGRLPSSREAVGRVAIDHVARNARFLRDDVDDVLGLDDQRLRLVDLDLDRSRVEPADGLVRQVKIANVLRRHLERRVDRFVRDRDRVILLQPRPQAQQNLARLRRSSARRP